MRSYFSRPTRSPPHLFLPRDPSGCTRRRCPASGPAAPSSSRRHRPSGASRGARPTAALLLPPCPAAAEEGCRGDREETGGPTHPMSQSMAGSLRPGWLPRPPRPSHRPLMRPRRAPPQRLAAGPAGAARLRLRSRGGRAPRSDTRALGRPEVNTRRSPRPAGGQPGSGPLPLPVPFPAASRGTLGNVVRCLSLGRR